MAIPSPLEPKDPGSARVAAQRLLLQSLCSTFHSSPPHTDHRAALPWFYFCSERLSPDVLYPNGNAGARRTDHSRRMYRAPSTEAQGQDPCCEPGTALVPGIRQHTR